jgi:hypothetical protein
MSEPEATTEQPHAPRQEVVETGILDLLTDQNAQQPWSADDLLREFGEKLAVEDAINNLKRVGLIHCCAGIVIPSRAALRFAELKW